MLGKDSPKMIFGIEAHHSADSGDRILTVFKVFDGDIDPY